MPKTTVLALRTRKSFIAGTTAAFTLGGGGAARAQSGPVTLRIGSGPADAYAQGWYGIDMGFFKNAGLDVTFLPFNSASLVTAAVLGGSCDIGCGTTLTQAVANAKGVPIGIVAAAAVNTPQGPQALLCVRKDGPIHTPKDLVGKTIGVNILGTSVDLAIQAWLVKNGLDAHSVKFIEVLADEVGPAIDRGTIDAFAQGEPALSAALRDNDVRVLADPMPAIAPRFLYASWFATPSFVKNNSDLVRRFSARSIKPGGGATPITPRRPGSSRSIRSSPSPTSRRCDARPMPIACKSAKSSRSWTPRPSSAFCPGP